MLPRWPKCSVASLREVEKDSSIDMTDAFKELLEQYRATFPDKVSELETCVERLTKPEDVNEVIEHLHGLVHKLSGSSGAYGMTELHDVTRLLNERLKALMAGERISIESLKGDIERLIAQLRHDSI